MEKTGEYPTYKDRIQSFTGNISNEEKKKFKEIMKQSQVNLERTVQDKGIYADYTIYDFFNYKQLSIEEALSHPHELIRAYAMFDARTGRQKLKAFEEKDEHPLVKQFLSIRISSTIKK